MYTDPNATCTDGDMRLVDGRFENEGRLEFCFQNHWGTVCDDDFNPHEAELVCRELGFLHEGLCVCSDIDTIVVHYLCYLVSIYTPKIRSTTVA